MKKQAMSAVIVLVILGLILSSCGSPTSSPPSPVPQEQELIRIDLPDRVIPDEGTIGTEFTITGLGFGDSKPIVSLGEANCTVLEWTDTAIRALLADTIPAGTYDVSIKPGAGDDAAIVLQQAFTVMPPSIDPIAPMDIWDMDKLTIQGSFFGSEAGKVFVVDQNDQAEECLVLEWQMESITFTIPEGLSDVYDIKIQNDVGSAAQTRVLNAWVPLPGNGAPQTSKTIEYQVDYGTHSAATGIYFGGKFWSFHSGLYGGTRYHVVYFNIFDGEYWTYYPLSPNAVYPKYNLQFSYYAPSPVIFNEKLYVFWVDKKTSKINYSIYEGQDKSPDGKYILQHWSELHTIDTISKGEVSVVYNPARERLELYFLAGVNKVGWTHTRDGQTWSQIRIIYDLPSLNLPPAAEAVEMFGGFQVMLAVRHPDNEEIQIYFIQDGKVNGSLGISYASTNFRPFLTNLGHGEIALLWRDQENYVNVCYYKEKSGKETDPIEKQGNFYGWQKWDDKYIWVGDGYPTGAVNFTWRNDDVILAKFWVFYQRKHVTDNYIYCRMQKELGMWKHVDTENHNWESIDDPEVFNLFPIIGIIDMPPFVKNGNTTAAQNNTRVVWGRGETHTQDWDYTATIGGYFKARTPAGVGGLEAEVHAGVSFKWGKEKTFSKKVLYTLKALEPSKIKVIYLAPALQMIQFRWFDESLRPTEDTMVFAVVTDVGILARIVDPSTDPDFQIPEFPLHEAGNLDTYGAKLDDSLYDISNKGTWDYGGPTEISFVEEKSHYFSVGTYLTAEIGYKWANLLSFGAEGSFTFSYTTQTTLTDTLRIVLDNPAPSVEGDTRCFTTTVYWAKPNDDGFWVPLSRRGCGDKPWFVTYTVSGINLACSQ